MKNVNMHEWLNEIKQEKVKKPMPVLTFPCIQLMNVTVEELISDSDLHGKGMKLISDRVDSLAAVSFMDLSLEAEAFGSKIKVGPDEVPTVVDVLVNNLEEAKALEVPSLNSKRIPIYIEGVRKAAELITDRPLFAGIIGPYSLAGRLVDVATSMIYCKKNPELMHEVLEKATQFLIKYAKEYKEKTGAKGIVMAEPLAGILNPQYIEEFSEPYVKRIAEAVRDENFLVIYHNCGNSTLRLTESIFRTECDVYHFGNAIDLKEMLDKAPKDKLIMGNINPASEFTTGTVESITETTTELLKKCYTYPNFVISSGCDIPPIAKWDNIDAFFKATKDFYDKL
ncbi:MAG: uroporphyrinogen decarboxylase family protein [Suipraeoptans sp.]